MAIRRVSDHRSELLEQQPKNGLALAFGPAQALGTIMEDDGAMRRFPSVAREPGACSLQ
jgi:hypothetical protein